MIKTGIKRTAVLLAAFVFTVMAITGCKKDAAGEESPGKGRYVEEDVEFPLDTGEQLISFSESKDGNPLIFSIRYIVKDGVQMEVKRYEYIDSEWNDSVVEWFAKMYGGHIAASAAV